MPVSSGNRRRALDGVLSIIATLSSTKHKEKEARNFGADHFIHTGSRARMKRASRSFDFMISTVSAELDWPTYLSLLRPGGQLCFVGVPKEPLAIPVGALIGGQKSISGSSIGGTRSMRQMLDFAAKHEIKPKVECLKMGEANLGISKVKDNLARYRIVLLNI